MVSIKARRDVRFRFYLPFSQCLLRVNTFLHRFANQYLSLPQVKVKQHYFPIWNSRCCSKLSCFSPSNICEWALKQVPRNNQVRRNVSRKRWKGKRALREPLWRSIVLHILSILLPLLLMISSQRRTDCGMRNISDLIFILLPAQKICLFWRDKKCEPGPGIPWLQFQLPNFFERCSEWIICIIKRRKQFDPIDVRPASDSPCKAEP